MKALMLSLLFPWKTYERIIRTSKTVYNSTIRLYRIFPSTDIYEDFNSDNHFCTIGSEDEFSLKFNNDTGEVYIYDYESNTYNKIADSICEIILMMKSIWRKHEN